MSAPEGVELAACPVDVVQIAALRGGEPALGKIAGGRGLELPEPGRLTMAAPGLALCVQPERWLVLSAPTPAGTAAAGWTGDCAGRAAVVDLSSALSVLHLAGSATWQLLARGCRLDPYAFSPGRVAATLIAQVSVILAAVPSGLLLLTPASTALHLREWLIHTGEPFRLTPRVDVTVAFLEGDT